MSPGRLMPSFKGWPNRGSFDPASDVCDIAGSAETTGGV